MGKPKRFYKRWTDGEVMVVNTMKTSGYSLEDIAQQLGRTVGSVRNVYYGVRHADVGATKKEREEAVEYLNSRREWVAETLSEKKPSLFHMILTILGIRK